MNNKIFSTHTSQYIIFIALTGVKCLRFISTKLAYLMIFVALFSSHAVAENVEVELDGTYIYSYPFVVSSIEINGTEFSHKRFTDELDDPWSIIDPIRGEIEISGNLVSLIHSRLNDSERHFRIIVDNGKSYLIADRDYEKWKKNKLNLNKAAHKKVKN